MIFDPTVGDDRNPIDTNSAEFKARVQWVCSRIGCEYPVESTYLATSPEAHNRDFPDVQASLHQYLNLIFAIDGNTKVAIDAEAVWLSPKAAVQGIAGVIGRPDLVAWGPDYAPPPSPAQDWEVPGFPVGSPFPAVPGCFQFRWTGEKEGAVVTGPISGRTYTLVRRGYGIFSSLEWRINA